MLSQSLAVVKLLMDISSTKVENAHSLSQAQSTLTEFQKTQPMIKLNTLVSLSTGKVMKHAVKEHSISRSKLIVPKEKNLGLSQLKTSAVQLSSTQDLVAVKNTASNICNTQKR
jgi:hypothetical protein